MTDNVVTINDQRGRFIVERIRYHMIIVRNEGNKSVSRQRNGAFYRCAFYRWELDRWMLYAASFIVLFGLPEDVDGALVGKKCRAFLVVCSSLWC